MTKVRLLYMPSFNTMEEVKPRELREHLEQTILSEALIELLCKTIGERAETIPKGSTLQVDGKGSAWHFKKEGAYKK